MELLFNGSIPKDYAFPLENEDWFNLNFIEHNIRIALSDGATISYNSQKWAKILVDYFIEIGNFSAVDIKKAISIYYAKEFDFNNMTLMQKRGLAFGSYATFLGVEYNSFDNNIWVLGIGDSIAVLLDKDNFIEAFPYIASAQFCKKPQMLSTNKRGNFFFTYSKNRSKFYKTWNLNFVKHPVLLCMTDALGEWALKEMESGNRLVWEELLSISNIKEFKSFIQAKRNDNMIKIDDTTLISVAF
ncbi:MAG: hypothetical protein LBJ88_00550 [Campylobacteraceae bacterium]|jgi:hypothetical protein|nr:hypothetical protein [Campylobacteraceae bacterium]